MELKPGDSHRYFRKELGRQTSNGSKAVQMVLEVAERILVLPVGDLEKKRAPFVHR